MIQIWLADIVKRRLFMNVVKILVSFFVAHLVKFNSGLSVAGITIVADPSKMTDCLNGFVFICLHELHMYVNGRYPELGKYL